MTRSLYNDKRLAKAAENRIRIVAFNEESV